MLMLCNPGAARISPAEGGGTGMGAVCVLRTGMIYGLSRRGLRVKAGNHKGWGPAFLTFFSCQGRAERGKRASCAFVCYGSGPAARRQFDFEETPE